MDSAPERHDNYSDEVGLSKIGEGPRFLQSEELPIKDKWKFLFKLDEENIMAMLVYSPDGRLATSKQT